MNTLLNLDPLFRQTVGFDRFNDLFETILETDKAATGYPPYNIEKLKDEHYRITMAVAGFSEKDIDIVVQKNTLVVTGKNTETAPKEQTTFLHRGIATRAFERKFQLADHIVVRHADLRDGLLKINLELLVPEAEKPKMIPINSNVIEGKDKK